MIDVNISKRGTCVEALVGPVINCLSLICGILMAAGVDGLIHRGLYGDSHFILSMYVISGVLVYGYIVFRSIKMIRKVSVLAILLAPIRGLASIIYLGCVGGALASACIPFIGLPFYFLYGLVGALMEKLMTTYVEYNESRGRVLLWF